MIRILSIEDDEVTAGEIIDELTGHGFQVDWVATGRDGLTEALSGKYDAITLDRMLPDLDGLSIVSALRDTGSNTPILVISALGEVDERVRGLRAGGDDYLIKPFAPVEMVARLEVLLRRKDASVAQTSLKVLDLELDLLKRIAYRAGYELRLSPTQFRLLEYFMRNPRQLLTRSMLLEAVWGMSFDPTTNIIDVHVTHLRKKVEIPGLPLLFRTVRGKGYVFGKVD